jgi:hypothetical protein
MEPHYPNELLEGLADGQEWHCWQCKTTVECLQALNRKLGAAFESWEDVFPEQAALAAMERAAAAEAAAAEAAGKPDRASPCPTQRDPFRDRVAGEQAKGSCNLVAKGIAPSPPVTAAPTIT